MFRLGRFRCYLLMVMENAPVAGLSAAVILAAIAVSGFIFSPWMGLAALGLDAFLFVMGLSFVIFAYGFHSVTGVNMSLHSLSLREDCVEISFEEGEPLRIGLDSLRPYKIYPGGVVVPVAGPKAGFIWIPPKAFDSPDMFRDFLGSLYPAGSEAAGAL